MATSFQHAARSFRVREAIAWGSTALSFGSLYYIFYVYARAPKTPPRASARRVARARALNITRLAHRSHHRLPAPPSPQPRR
jgi:hypothetical protein